MPMITTFKQWILPVVLAGVLTLFAVPACRGEVVVFDRVTTVQTAIHITVLTKGYWFVRGGRLVDIYLDDNHLKRILTGGDGYGYLKYTPQSPGLKKIRARSDADSATGLLLVMDRSEKAIIIDLEGAFKDAVFSEEIRENGRKAVTTLSREYKIIYLSRYFGQSIGRSWLQKENFPESVILRGPLPDLFAVLKDRGVQLHAVIGSADVISEAAKYIEKRYTFEESGDGKTVKDWDEIVELLKSAAPAPAPREKLIDSLKNRAESKKLRGWEGEKMRS
jgi:hypothetical protein